MMKMDCPADVVDTSAILSVLLFEQDAREFAGRMGQAVRRYVPSTVILEASIVMLARHGEIGWRNLDALLASARFETVAVDENHVLIARDAYRRFGKGRHRAALNFGDCLSYAVAKAENMPLLFKSDDFRLTDIEAAL